MSTGYIDPISKKYVQSAGNFNVFNAPKATEDQMGIMTPEQVHRLNISYTSDDVATKDEIINELFNK